MASLKRWRPTFVKHRQYSFMDGLGEKRKRAQYKYRAKQARRLKSQYFESGGETKTEFLQRENI